MMRVERAGIPIAVKEERENKSVMATFRLRPSVKARLEAYCGYYHYSQSDFLEALINSFQEQAKKDGCVIDNYRF